MKILFDHQIFGSQRFGGVSKYFAEIIHRLPADCWEVPAWLSNNEYSLNYQLFRHTRFFPNRSFRGQGRIMAALGKPYAYYRMLRSEYDVVHQTNFDTFLFGAIKNKPMVTTYHDTNFVTERNFNKRMLKLQTKSLQRADAVIAISEYTKQDMLNYFDIDPAKITVIHHGIDQPHIPEALSARIFEKPYILYVGMRHAFKNFVRFAQAFALIAKQYPEVQVVCTRSTFTAEEQALFQQLGIIDRMHHVVADEITLNRLYRDALFFVFPSTYEGFGMPILEAMINRCPVVLANASCFPEIAADAALYFDPYEIDEIAYQMSRMLSDEALRQQFAHSGLERVKLFSWQRCADTHLNVYKSLI